MNSLSTIDLISSGLAQRRSGEFLSEFRKLFTLFQPSILLLAICAFTLDKSSSGVALKPNVRIVSAEAIDLYLLYIPTPHSSSNSEGSEGTPLFSRYLTAATIKQYYKVQLDRR